MTTTLSRRNALLLLSSSMVVTGFKSCHEQQDSLSLLVSTLGHAISSLAGIAGNTELAQRLQDHTNTAVAIISHWQPGQNAMDAIRALNRIIDDLALFPQRDKFRPLLEFVLGTIASIIEQLGAGEAPHTPIRIPRPPKSSEEFRNDWDSIRGGSVGLEAAPVI